MRAYFITGEFYMRKKAKYSPKRIFKIRDKICKNVLYLYEGMQLHGTFFDRAVFETRLILSPKIDNEVVKQSMLSLLGTVITKESARLTAWRLAGNIDKLLIGVPVGPWVRQTEVELVPVHILEVIPCKDRFGNFGCTLKYRILAGSAAGLIGFAWRRKEWFGYGRAKLLGFRNRPRKNKSGLEIRYPYQRPIEFTSMRLMIELRPELSSDEGPGWQNIGISSACTTHNKTILKARQRYDYVCPIGATQSCFQCHVGTDRCMAGCHPSTYELKTCSNCGKEANHDPRSKHDLCLSCANKL